MADEEAPAEAPAEAAPAEAPAPEPAAEAPAEAAAPPAEPAHEAPKEPEPGAPHPEPAKGDDAAAPSADAAAAPGEADGVTAPPPEGIGEPLAKSSGHDQPTVADAEGGRAGSKKGDSLVRTSSVSFNKPAPEIQRPSTMEQRKSSLHPRGSRPSKDARRSTRKSYFSMMSIKRGSYASFQERSKTPKYMNSYKLESDRPFNVDKVNAILAAILIENIDETMTYDADSCPTKAKQVSGIIRAKVKEQDFDRYKLVCVVTIGEKKSHDIFTGIRFLWDAERDKYATYMHENMYVFAVASVFALYYE